MMEDGHSMGPTGPVPQQTQQGMDTKMLKGGRFDFDDGGTYCGGWQDGKAHGHGVCTGPKGQGEYSGSWHYGFEVSGVYRWPSGATFEGIWQNGKRHGLGVEYRGKWVYKGEWTQGYKGRYGVRSSLVSNAKYEGTWANGLQDGYGSETYADGGTYLGQWLRGMRHGYGIRQSAPWGHCNMTKTAFTERLHHHQTGHHSSIQSLDTEGETVGERKREAVRGGFVLVTRPTTTGAAGGTSSSAGGRRGSLSATGGGSGNRGLFRGLRLRKQRSTGDLDKASQRSMGGASLAGSLESGMTTPTPSLGMMDDGLDAVSNASFLSHEGDILDPSVTEHYAGEWKNDKRSGFGVCERSDGVKYEGEWYHNKKYGYGVTTFRDGTREEGKYKNNVLVTSVRRRHLFMLRSAKIRERVETAVLAARRAQGIALQKADIAISRTATAKGKGEQADYIASEARNDSTIAANVARQYGYQDPMTAMWGGNFGAPPGGGGGPGGLPSGIETIQAGTGPTTPLRRRLSQQSFGGSSVNPQQQRWEESQQARMGTNIGGGGGGGGGDGFMMNNLANSKVSSGNFLTPEDSSGGPPGMVRRGSIRNPARGAPPLTMGTSTPPPQSMNYHYQQAQQQITGRPPAPSSGEGVGYGAEYRQQAQYEHSQGHAYQPQIPIQQSQTYGGHETAGQPQQFLPISSSHNLQPATSATPPPPQFQQHSNLKHMMSPRGDGGGAPPPDEQHPPMALTRGRNMGMNRQRPAPPLGQVGGQSSFGDHLDQYDSGSVARYGGSVPGRGTRQRSLDRFSGSGGAPSGHGIPQQQNPNPNPFVPMFSSSSNIGSGGGSGFPPTGGFGPVGQPPAQSTPDSGVGVSGSSGESADPYMIGRPHPGSRRPSGLSRMMMGTVPSPPPQSSTPEAFYGVMGSKQSIGEGSTTSSRGGNASWRTASLHRPTPAAPTGAGGPAATPAASKDSGSGLKRQPSLIIGEKATAAAVAGKPLMSREEAAAMSHAQRLARTQDAELREKLSRNPLLYLTLPAFHDWLSRQQLIILVILINTVLAVFFFHLFDQ